jgi:23S rRNA (uracil1939-C5)-methyltransferase/tRNA (uracil-5-)-methyltransferase
MTVQEQPARPVAKPKFNAHPFAYHQELDLEIATLTNLGSGLARVPLPGPAPEEVPTGAGWVVMVPFSLPGEKVRARVYRNHRNYSEADLIEVLEASPHRTEAPCPLFGRCGGCQYQHLAYPEQLAWKQRQVAELLEHLAGIAFPVQPVIGSPRHYGYRSKITPHFADPRRAGRLEEDFPIGFLRQGTRFDLIDVPRCLIATDAINERLAQVREEARAKAVSGGYPRGATVLLREAGGQVVTDFDAVIIEEIALEPPLRLRFRAHDFFQNNPFILPVFVEYVRAAAAESGARFLVDAYCGSGLFALGAAPAFERVAGVEISETSVAFAQANAAANGIANCQFLAGDAAAIFLDLDFPGSDTVVVIDPPRKGCDSGFLQQLFAFGPRAVVYVSCDPATQMRDLTHFLAAGYRLAKVQPFDLFPQTRHLECVLTLHR